MKRPTGRPPTDPAEHAVRLACYVKPHVVAVLKARARRDGFDRLGPWLAAQLTRMAEPRPVRT